jgi:hypothetical protein
MLAADSVADFGMGPTTGMSSTSEQRAKFNLRADKEEVTAQRPQKGGRIPKWQKICTAIL